MNLLEISFIYCLQRKYFCFSILRNRSRIQYGVRLLILLISINFISDAQSSFWGLTNGGGEGGGTLFTTNGFGQNDTVKYNFPQTAGGTKPHGGLITASNGKIYGTTEFGGYYGDATSGGTLFEFDPNNLSIVIKAHFGNPYLANGALPMGVLTESNGKLYGMTSSGGIWGGGTIFEYNMTTGNHTKLWDFKAYNDPTDTIGGYPLGGLLPASNGKLYGSTFNGNPCVASFFEFDPISRIMTKVFNCRGGQGSFEYTQLSNGKIYGQNNDPNTGIGRIFDFNPVSKNFTDYYVLGNSLSFSWSQSFSKGNDDKLYVNIQEDFIGVGEFDPVTNVYNQYFLDQIDLSNGALLHLLLGSDGKFYATAINGRGYNVGLLFSFDPISKTFTKLYAFDGLNGAEPAGFLTQAPNGKIYGTTYSGGKEDKGSLFQYDPVTNIYTKVYDFIIEPQSTSPQSSLLFLADTIAYGSTMKGGKYLNGTVFSYVPRSNTFTNLFDFDSTATGGDPTGSLIQANNGILYGMASAGGSAGLGTLYAFTPSGKNFSKRYDFTTLAGANPTGALLQAPNGLLYGLASQGGSSGNGVLFSFNYNATTSGYTKKIDLDGATMGSNPKGSLVTALGLNAKLYGMTENGGSTGLGIIFSYDYTSNTFTNIHNFTTLEGTHPDGSLVLAKDNLFYGMTSSGGTNGQGTLFSFNPATNTFTKKQDLTLANGADPQGSLWQATNGKLYGMTKKGGNYNLGIVFEYDYVSNTLTKTVDFNWDNGASPVYGNLVEVCAIPKIKVQPQNIVTCVGSAFQLNMTATGVRAYQWFANGISVTGANQSVLTIGGAASFKTYYCRIANECGTITSQVITVTGNPLPTITGTVFPAPVCYGNPVTITGSGAPMLTVSGGMTSGIGFVPTISGMYTISGTNVNQCKNITMVTVTVNSLPVLTINGNPAICNKEPASLTASGANTYLWSNGITDSVNTVSPTSNATYSVTGTGLNGCATTKQILVTVGTLPRLSITGKNTICQGTSAILSASGANTYSWNIGMTTTGITIAPNADTTYTVTGTGNNGCSNTASLTVKVNSLPVVFLDLSAINNKCDTLSPVPLVGGSPENGIYLYSNKTITGLNTSIAGDYQIIYQYKDMNGCVNTATGILTSIHCTVPGICERPIVPCYCTNTCPPRFKIYAGITPNGDGSNDTWYIDSLPSHSKVTILDKWGSEVYQTENYLQNWDGTKDEKQLPPGIYYYVIETGTNKRRFSGTVSVLR